MPSAVRGQVGNLPHEVTSFVGRRQEVMDARRCLAASRLVTLTGIGGVGKTRLALRVGQDARRAFPDGVWFVDLGLLTSPDLLGDAVAAALGMREVLPGESSLAEFLADRHLLLILDNCEHLVDAVAELAGSLLRTCRELRILATSREPLGVAGESVLRVPPLAVPDPDRAPSGRRLQAGSEAVTLFEERAGAVVPGFGVTDDNRAAVTLICQRLDGLPLPIELAAARLRAMSAEQILQRLTDRYRLLGVGSRGGPTRQQTLRTCIDWSYELCTARERELWSRLSVFRGRFELDAAEAICGQGLAPDELFDLVASLVDKSILNRDEEAGVVGYGMLETLRDYGAEKLRQIGEQDRLRRRHRDWYEALVVRSEAEWLGPEQKWFLARMDRERANIREATRFCLADAAEAESGLRLASAMWPYALTRGLLPEGRRWIDRALIHQGGDPTPARARALCAYIMLASNQGQTDAARPRIDELRAVAQVLRDPVIDAQVAHAVGYCALFGEDPEHAVVVLGGALDVLRDADPLRHVSALLGMGLAHGILGDVDRATRSQEEALAIAEARGDTVYRAYCLLILALALVRTEPRRAGELLHEVVRLEREVDDILGAAVAVEAMAWIAADANDAGRAAVLLGAAQALWRTVGSGSVNVLAMRGFHEDCVQRTTRALGERAYGVAFRRGADSTFADAVAHALGERPVGPVPQVSVLTRRERQVADLVAEGMTNRAIAETLVISRRTAEGHVEHVLTKLGFNSRSQIAAWVAEQRSGDPD